MSPTDLEGQRSTVLKQPQARLLILAPSIVLLLCLMFTFYIWGITRDNIDYQTQLKFERQIEEVKLVLKWRLELYINALYGAQALFAASEHVDRDEWAAYTQKEDLGSRYPGIIARSFIERAAPEEGAAGQKDRYIVKYVEPYAGNEKLMGFDLGTDPVRLAALEAARDTGKPAATGRINLASPGSYQPGFAVFMPVYRNGLPFATLEERRAALLGFVDATFAVKDLLSNLLSKESVPPNIDFEIFVKEALARQEFLYRHSDSLPGVDPGYSPKYMASKRLRFVSKFWNLNFKALPRFDLGDIKQHLPTFVLVAGISFSFLLFGILYSLNASRTIQQINEGLEREIEERLRMEEELRMAKKTADDANQAKSKFLAHMSHELRTPLNAVIGFSEVLKSKSFGPLNEKQEEYLMDIWESCRHLLSLINDILDLSKVEAGKMQLDLVEVDLKALLKNSLLVIKEKALSHHLKLSLNIDDGIGPVKADERKVRQILFNLLSNAEKFTPEGGEICLGAKQLGPQEVLVSLRDTGIGIDQKDRGKVFAEFEQIENSLSRTHTGTGLGMPLAKKFVELHGGRMWFESAGRDQGTCFYFTLPLAPMAKTA